MKEKLYSTGELAERLNITRDRLMYLLTVIDYEPRFSGGKRVFTDVDYSEIRKLIDERREKKCQK